MPVTVNVDHLEDFFCDMCHGEFTVAFEAGSDILPVDIKKCVFCGEDLDNEFKVPEDEFDIDEWNDDMED